MTQMIAAPASTPVVASPVERVTRVAELLATRFPDLADAIEVGYRGARAIIVRGSIEVAAERLAARA